MGSQRVRARAVGRAHLPGLLDARRFALARAETARIGRTILAERRRRAAAPLPAHAPRRDASAQEAGPRRTWLLAGLAAAALILGAAALLRPQGGSPGGGVPTRRAAEASAVPFTGLFGVTSPSYRATPAPVAAASPSPAGGAPSATPGVNLPGSGAAGTGPAGSGGGGGGGGTGGGTGGGSGGGVVVVRPPAPTPTPRPTELFAPTGITGSPVLPGFQRFQGVVVDPLSRPVAGVCVGIGPRGCQPISEKSDAAGTWSVDLPAGLTWDFHFEKAGYDTTSIRFAPGTQQGVTIIVLKPLG